MKKNFYSISLDNLYSNMRRIIFCNVVQLFLLFTSIVESLKGTQVMQAKNNEFPFVASLQCAQGQHFCSGVLITSKHVITAAHCLDDEQPEKVSIILGVVDLRTSTVRYSVQSWITYKDWANGLHVPGARLMHSLLHDIAIITLTDGIAHPNIRPIRLTDLKKQHVQGKKATMLGWGGGLRNEILEKATVNVLSDQSCGERARLLTNQNLKSDERILCTHAQPYVLMQEGDSGAPLIDMSGALLGISKSFAPQANASWGNFSEEFLRSYQVNLHCNIPYQYYRNFIVNVTNYH